MDKTIHDKVTLYLTNQLAQAASRLKAYTTDRSGQPYLKRNAAIVLEKHIRNYSQTGSEPRWVAIPGLRGVGKTTLLAQIYSELNCGPNCKLYISLDEATKVLGINLIDILTVYEEFLGTTFEKLSEPIYLFIDEVQYEENWGLVLKSLYDRTNKVFIFCTGSSALSLQANPDVSRRVVFEKLYPMSFTEYKLIKDRHYPVKGLGTLIREAILNCSSAEDLYKQLKKLESEVNKYWSGIDRFEVDNYLKYGSLPFALQYTEEPLIYEQIEQTLTNVINKDIPQMGKFDSTTLSRMSQILFMIASSDITSLQRISKELSMSVITLTDIFEAFEKSEVLLRIYPYGSLYGQVRKPSKYLFLSSAYRNMFFNLIGSTTTFDNYKGKLMEDITGLYFYRVLGLRFGSSLTYDSAAEGADFILTIKQQKILVEVGYGEKRFEQVIKSLKRIGGKYGISISPTELTLNKEEKVIAIPLKFFLLI